MRGARAMARSPKTPAPREPRDPGDTSAWVEYDRATGSTTGRRLSELIAAEGPIAVTEPVIMEVLANARTDAREADLRRLLLRFHLYHFDAAADFDSAVRIYRRCRQVGITPRGLVDCMSPGGSSGRSRLRR